MGSTSTLKNSVIFPLFLKYVQGLNQPTPYLRAITQKLETLWGATDDEHRHVIIDVLANSTVESTQYSVPWGSIVTLGNPKNIPLKLIMECLGQHPVQEHSITLQETLPPKQYQQVHQEISEQIMWRLKNPYAFEGTITPIRQDGSPENVVAGPHIYRFGLENCVNSLAAVTMSPARMAPVVLKHVRASELYPLYPLHRKVPLAAQEGAETLIYQQGITDTSVTAAMITLTHCPEALVEKYFHNRIDDITGSDYQVWAEKMEHMFPAQKYAYQRTSEGVNYDAYYAWEYLKATHQVNSIFEETDTTSLPDITPAMKEWLEDTASEPEMVLTQDTYIF